MKFKLGLCFFLLILLFHQIMSLKFIYKKNKKIIQKNEFNIPQTPELSKYIYPSLQYYLSKNTKYNEFIPSEDLAQIETRTGLLSPMNILFTTKINGALLKDSLSIEDK